MQDYNIEAFSNEASDGTNPKSSIKTGSLLSVIVLVVAFAIMTTNVNISSAFDFANIGLSFFIILFLSNLIYLINFSSSAQKAKKGEIYLEAKRKYDEIKGEISSLNWMDILENFCTEYIEKELIRTRTGILLRVGISYDAYSNKYIGKTKAELKNEKLPPGKIKAIAKANKVKPIVLTPEMIYKFSGKDGGQRNPLGISPEKRSNIRLLLKVISSFLTSLLTAAIALEFVLQPSWQMFCFCLVKMLPIINNWFKGSRDGTESVETDQVGYISVQTDLLNQAINFKNAHSGQKVDNKMQEAL